MILRTSSKKWWHSVLSVSVMSTLLVQGCGMFKKSDHRFEESNRDEAIVTLQKSSGININFDASLEAQSEFHVNRILRILDKNHASLKSSLSGVTEIVISNSFQVSKGSDTVKLRIDYSADERSILEFLERSVVHQKIEENLKNATQLTKVQSVTDLIGLDLGASNDVSTRLTRAFLNFDFKGRSLKLYISDVERMGMDTLFITSDTSEDRIKVRAAAVRDVSEQLEQKFKKMAQATGLAFELLQGAINEEEANSLAKSLDSWVGVFLNRNSAEILKISKVLIARRNAVSKNFEKFTSSNYVLVDYANSLESLRGFIDALQKSPAELAKMAESVLMRQAQEKGLQLEISNAVSNRSVLEAFQSYLISTITDHEMAKTLNIRVVKVSDNVSELSLKSTTLQVPASTRMNAIEIKKFLDSELEALKKKSEIPVDDVGARARKMIERSESSLSSSMEQSMRIRDESGATWSAANIEVLSNILNVIRDGLKMDDVKVLLIKQVTLAGKESPTFVDATAGALVLNIENSTVEDIAIAISKERQLRKINN